MVVDAAKLADRIDPQVRDRLDRYVALVGPGGLSAIADLTERRRVQAEVHRSQARPMPAGFEVTDHHVARAAGPSLLVRTYRPASAADPVPCVYYLHGGGLVAGSVEQDDARAAALAADAGCVVASVDYRLAPEHPYPAALEDCRAGLEHLVGHAADLGIDPARIALFGPSAGGTLATGLALLLRDTGGPAPGLLLLVSPMLDDRAGSVSARTNTGFGAWSREATLQSWAAYLGDDAGTDRVPAYAAPARADDLAGLPPTYVDVGDLDPFRDEAVDLVRGLAAAGVPVELHVYPGGIHGGESLAPDAELTRRVRDQRLAALRRFTSDRSSRRTTREGTTT